MIPGDSMIGSKMTGLSKYPPTGESGGMSAGDDRSVTVDLPGSELKAWPSISFICWAVFPMEENVEETCVAFAAAGVQSVGGGGGLGDTS